MKLKSMTGFGRAEVSNDQYRLSVEVKSVNSRFLDLSIKMHLLNELMDLMKHMGKRVQVTYY